MPKGRTRRTARIVSRLAGAEAARAARSRGRRPEAQPSPDAGKAERARHIRRTLEELGPLYVKVGQILATRPDFVPQYIRDELENLNDKARVEPFARFEPVLEQDLGPRWRAGFQSIRTEEPLGSASLAQVYKAVDASGRACVVKIQRPEAHEAVLGDMSVLKTAVRLFAKAAPHFNEVVDIGAMLEVLFTVMHDELDFTREARNMKDARKAAKDFKRVCVPKALTATPRVLVQTFAEGSPVNRVKPDELSKKQRKAIAYQLMEFMFRGYFIDRRFHADPHPGNIIVSTDGKAHLIDWGMVGRIDRGTSLATLGVFLALAQNDGAAMARHWVSLGTATPWSNPSAFLQDISRIVPHWTDASLDELNFGVALMTLLRYSSQRGIQITPLTSVVGKSVANIEGSVRCLYPKLKLSTALHGTLRNVMRDLILETLSEEQASQTALHLLGTLIHGPAQLQSSLTDLSTRQLTFQARNNLGDPIQAGRRHRGAAPTISLPALALGASWAGHRFCKKGSGS
ncbi:ubiquinone biosynthesis monooxygenase UbiB [Streptomyces rimosus subsp. rimosus]|uniref:AarF/ABC1/UbiB kinase family protein n=2 Tax=Streptomyces rimosus subsp. rimosus TaxID=132474 RepID=L8EWN4_STRR1|nr:AarF/UbiB family protein [Streptomyces rimosus]KOG73428.1 ubiquinone biosynthesis monooxygenase UbiB [Kitasatospora aureofaciens]KOT39658.1 ubiquinone biosynthesis monooxygenase UbiB [Streptomyces rimosus subsp. rimosus]KOT39908.1 ubiquinone biosynthesis monooxygenase UbiB [Streptomyces sp. NRRL WC-3701]MYT45659.1 AarF/ABC1/UbiB kinase family protein [Streptomyces sp. SID5471]QST84967.1 AarF/ABC1/UbiB kinase family protein [Streptomyces rimosus subsp. rimosus ATCC 10970]